VVEDRLDPLLTGPTAITFVRGDAAAVAKLLRDYARGHQALVVKGGLLGDKGVTAKDVEALAHPPSRDGMLAPIAGAFPAPPVERGGARSRGPLGPRRAGRAGLPGPPPGIPPRAGAPPPPPGGGGGPPAEPAPPAPAEAPAADAADAPDAAAEPAAADDTNDT